MIIKKYNKLSKKTANIENIPQGVYCYDQETGVCPYWELKKNKPYQENGYCHFMKKGDWELGYNSLLWDQCKECKVFSEINEFEYKPINFIELIRYYVIRFFLWKTINKIYRFKEKLQVFLHGKICRCKFCRKYYLISNSENNLTCCSTCKIEKTINK